MRRIAVLTSGGDAPGMNAAIRAVVRTGLARGFEVVGVHHGYTGLIGGHMRPLSARDVGGIIQLGGTMLGTTRCEKLKTESGLRAAMTMLKTHEISAVAIIGGNGSQTGAAELSRRGAAVVGIASSIDNDLYGTDISIGTTTAIDVALEAIDRIRVTASAMNRAFMVEVMGLHCGHLAISAGIAGGAEVIVVPERESDAATIVAELQAAQARGKSHAIAVVAEGARFNAEALMSFVQQQPPAPGFDLRVTKLGHIQRGGAPGVFDRMLGTRLGAAAVEAIVDEHYGVLIGMQNGNPARAPLEVAAGRARPADTSLLKLAHILAQ